MGIIDRYIARNFLAGAAVVLLILLPLFGFMVLSEELENVGKGAFTSFDALWVVALSLPKLMLDLLPVTALLGVLIGLGAMANNQELVILNAFGYSAGRTAKPVVETILVVIAAVLLVQAFVVPKFELGAARVRSKATLQTTIASEGKELWTRSGNRFIRIGDAVQNRLMREVEIFDMGDDGKLRELIQAASAEDLGDGQWVLRDVEITDLGLSEVTESHFARKLWQSSLSTAEMSTLMVPVEAMAPVALYKYIQLLDQNGLNTHRYRVILWQQLSLPVGLMAMALLGLPFLMGSVRSIPAGQRAAIGGGIGILFYLSEQMMGHFALLFELPPAPAALAPDAVLLVLAIVFLHRTN